MMTIWYVIAYDDDCLPVEEDGYIKVEKLDDIAGVIAELYDSFISLGEWVSVRCFDDKEKTNCVMEKTWE
jgi:hypothetical protein